MEVHSIILLSICLIEVRLVNAYKQCSHFDRKNGSHICSVLQEKMILRLVSPPPGETAAKLAGRPRTIIKYKMRRLNYSNQIDNSDPLDTFNDQIDTVLVGKAFLKEEEQEKTMDKNVKLNKQNDPYLHYPTGTLMRAERFAGHASVHMMPEDSLHRGHAQLRLTPDYLQTAVDAFFFFTHGTLQDVMGLPADYILKSARTISMIHVNLEKLSATWEVVKGGRAPEQMPYEVLELYRPLFKYLSPREIASLNLSDERIMTYIGTHPDLERHQVGAVASRYMKLNPNWWEAQNLNLMSNVMCGIPINIMRKLNPNVFLQLNHQVFFHIRACDPLQRRFFLNMMTKTQVLGRPFSWTARDVTRLGLLIPNMKGKDISNITPDAVAGITAQVVQEMSPDKLSFITDRQRRYLGEKAYNILVRKLKFYKYHLGNKSQGITSTSRVIMLPLVLIVLALRPSS